MKVINFEEWKKKSKKNNHHLKIKKPFDELNESEVRILLEKIVDGLNFSIDQMYKSYQLHDDAFSILNGMIEKQNGIIKNINSLNNIAKNHTEILTSQSKMLGVIKD